MAIDLSKLNDEQLAPVMDTEGAVLVTAGAGSGKTRLLTYRIAHIIEDLNVPPYNVLALTFTNKAAGEMKERLSRMGVSDGVWVFTFHALCVRILRKFITALGFSQNFTIYGETERLSVIKKVLKDKKVEDDDLSPQELLSEINSAKTENISPEKYSQIYKFQSNCTLVSELYSDYNATLKRNNALDYDDLLNFCYDLLVTNEEARVYCQNKFRYIFIDEFQDTNTVQYEIVKILSKKWGNIFAVGDEDQSIYGWRGANFKNIFNFKNDFPSVRLYKLERNYRSTKKIISLANKVIKNNVERLDKNLWTDNEDGSPVVFYVAKSDKDEADYVLNVMNRLITYEGYKISDFAILMRLNALTRSFEEKFIQYGISHKIFGGFKFFDRKEIKDVLAYLKLFANHNDDESLLRIINVPKRGIGEATVSQLINYCKVENKSLYDVILNVNSNPDLPQAVIKKIRPLSTTFECMENAMKVESRPSVLTKYLCKVTSLKDMFDESSDENESAKMNIRELVHGMEEYEKDNEEVTLQDYLQVVSLYSDTDEMDSTEYVTLATIHSAKGLEFKVVFLVGMEDGVFPTSKSVAEDDRVEEERRLLYVAITRAQKKLFITRAKTRFKFGSTEYTVPSRFMKELGVEEKKKEEVNPFKSSYPSYNRSYSKSSPEYKPDEVPSFDDNVASISTKLKTSTNVSMGKDLSKFKVGIKVRHKKFGEGIIKKVSIGADTCVTVAFSGLGEISLMLAYAPLEIIE